MPKQDHHPSSCRSLVLAGDLERDAVADAIKRYDLNPDATTEVP
jgi:hypothetical protein